mmetsp:Transcript_2248/g.3329  ORF Transcript_2248/g.3329 Transcript_2248/m.3329 type:complete len:314 (-) Transcript_2248:1057-1998(-)
MNREYRSCRDHGNLRTPDAHYRKEGLGINTQFSNETTRHKFSVIKKAFRKLLRRKHENKRGSIRPRSTDEDMDSTPFTLTCPLCYDEFSSNFVFFLGACNHTFCTQCLPRHIRAQIDLGNAANMLCPMPKKDCGKPIMQDDLRSILDSATFERLERIALASAVAADPTLHYCPTPNCSFIVNWDKSEYSGGTSARFHCPKCNSTSCLKCATAPYHDGISCEDFMKKSEHCREECLTKKYLKTHQTRQCKRCSAWVSKQAGGCYKMKCRCGYRFCFVCGSENAQCGHTPANHGFTDNITGEADFSRLQLSKSPT